MELRQLRYFVRIIETGSMGPHRILILAFQH